MAQVSPEIVRKLHKLKSQLHQSLRVKRMFLFGSYAKGTYSENSDIDVCIITDGVQDNFLTMLDIAPIAVHVDPRIEAVVFSSREYAEDPTYGLLGEIKRTGIEI